MSEYSYDCGSCSTNCDNRKADKSELLKALNPASSVRRMIGVVSGKGGVGKSLVALILAVSMNHRDKKTAVLNADITGPSISMASGIGSEGMTTSPDDSLMLPAKSVEDMEIISVNLPLDRDTDPVIRRGPVTARAVKQFWSEALWQDVDYMFVDMPSGTGDVSLIVFQPLPVDGVTIATSPQGLVGVTVVKTVNIAKKMNIPIVGVVENMSYLEYPDCGKRASVFGEGHVEEITTEHGIKVLAQIPIDLAIAQMVDVGRVEYLEMSWFDEAVKAVEVL